MVTEEERQKLKDDYMYYRLAAARLGRGSVGVATAVNLTADRDGGFVEVVVWVSKEEMEKERRRESKKVSRRSTKGVATEEPSGP